MQHIIEQWKEKKRAEFTKKCKTSYTQGGFLTTDLDGSWQIDTDSLRWYMQDYAISLLTLLEKEVGERLTDEGKIALGVLDGINQ